MRVSTGNLSLESKTENLCFIMCRLCVKDVYIRIGLFIVTIIVNAEAFEKQEMNHDTYKEGISSDFW